MEAFPPAVGVSPGCRGVGRWESADGRAGQGLCRRGVGIRTGLSGAAVCFCRHACLLLPVRKRYWPVAQAKFAAARTDGRHVEKTGGHDSCPLLVPHGRALSPPAAPQGRAPFGAGHP